MIPKNIKSLQWQSRQLNVRQVAPNILVVESDSNPSANHIVTVAFGKDDTVKARCTCRWAQHRGIACTHVMAALEHLAAKKDRTLSFWSSEDDAQRQKNRTFRLVGGDDAQVWITSRND